MKKQKNAVEGTGNVPDRITPLHKQPATSPQPPSPEAVPVPTATELAMIAATLRPSHCRNWEDLVSLAFDLWKACDEEIRRRSTPRRRALDTLCAGLPEPETYPVPLERFLELILPKKRGPGRVLAYRHFLMDWQNLNLGQAGDLLAEHRKQPAERFDFRKRAFLLQAWIAADLKCTRSLGGIERHGLLTKKRKAAEEIRGSEQRKASVAEADDLWSKASYEDRRYLMA